MRKAERTQAAPGEYRPGELVTVNAGTKSGYTFQEWLAEGVTLSEDEKSKPEITFEMPEQAVTLTATWSAVSSGSSRPSYQPDVEDTEGGTVTVSPTRPRKGDTVTITPKPDEGYMVYEVAVTDRDGDPVKVTAKGDGTYTFTQPSGKVTIEVTFREKKAPGLPFTDLEPGAWYYDAVEYVYENGLWQAPAVQPSAPMESPPAGRSSPSSTGWQAPRTLRRRFGAIPTPMWTPRRITARRSIGRG